MDQKWAFNTLLPGAVSVVFLSWIWSPHIIPIMNFFLIGFCLVRVSCMSWTLQRDETLRHIQSHEGMNLLLKEILPILAQSTQLQDPILRGVFSQRFRTLLQDSGEILSGVVTFRSTEQWRELYQQILASPGLYRYRSVSVVKSESYWRGEAGRKSMELNLRLSAENSVLVERVVILADELWPNPVHLPVPPIQEWLIEQHHHEITLWLVRESEVRAEVDLVADIGIYGSRAVGTQLAEGTGETQQFTLRFGLEHVEAAEEKWKRLMVYAVKYSDFLDRYSVSS